jgi:hypothetical protein
MLITKVPPLSVSSYYSNPVIHLNPQMHKPSYVVGPKDYLLLDSEHAPTLFFSNSGIKCMGLFAQFLNLNLLHRMFQLFFLFEHPLLTVKSVSNIIKLQKTFYHQNLA